MMIPFFELVTRPLTLHFRVIYRLLLIVLLHQLSIILNLLQLNHTDTFLNVLMLLLFVFCVSTITILNVHARAE